MQPTEDGSSYDRRRLRAAWSVLDVDAALALVTCDCVFESTERGPDGTRYERRNAVCKAWQPIFDETHAAFHAEETIPTRSATAGADSPTSALRPWKIAGQAVGLPALERWPGAKNRF